MNNKNPIDSKPMIKELQEKLKNKNFKDVIKKCDTILNDASESKVEPYLFKAYALRESDEHDKAQEVYVEGLKAFPGDVNLLNDFSKLLILKKDYLTAKQILENILKINPNDNVAAVNLKNLEEVIKQKSQEDTANQLKHEASRSLNPLQSAFNPSEIKASSDNLKKVKKIRLEKKLQQLPTLPLIEEDILADEWLDAAKDALRSKHPDLALKFCEYSAQNNGNLSQTYGVAGDAYIELKQFKDAHLCYLIAIENGELESAQQLNLLFLTAMIGDKKLLEKRNSNFNERLQEQPKLHQRSQKILTKIGDISTVKFNPKYGPISEESLNEQINNN